MKHRLLIFISSVFLAQICWAEVYLSKENWNTCEYEHQKSEFPRNCMLIAIFAKKRGYMDFYQFIEEGCLKNIGLWGSLEMADEQIIKSYFNKCYYRYKQIKQQKSPIIEDISVVKEKLVRFLYLNE